MAGSRKLVSMEMEIMHGAMGDARENDKWYIDYPYRFLDRQTINKQYSK
jgi:hypothetical protein